MGFNAFKIEEIWRLLANNQYSILINGQAHDFFHSSRGVKQGNFLSPALFIISFEVLLRTLNNLLFDNKDFKSFGMPKWSDNINHLAYTNDTIIFVSANNISLVLLMDILETYEKESDHKINKEKSLYYMFNKIVLTIVKKLGVPLVLKEETFP